MDSHDKAYYPQKGYRFKVRGDLIMAENSVIYPHAWMRTDGIFSISSKLKIIAEGFLGVASRHVDTTMFRYNTGGMENNRIDWYNAFPGLRFLEKGSSNVWILKVSPRYEFYKNNYLTYTFALMAMDKNTFKMFSDAEDFYSGMSLKYGFDSMFGPLEISVDYSLQSYYSHVFVSLGYWF
jgi:NTE family protein